MAAMNKARQILKCRDAQLGSPTQGKSESVTFNAGVSFEDAVGGRIIGVSIYRVRPDLLERSGKAQVENAHVRDLRIPQDGSALLIVNGYAQLLLLLSLFFSLCSCFAAHESASPWSAKHVLDYPNPPVCHLRKLH